MAGEVNRGRRAAPAACGTPVRGAPPCRGSTGRLGTPASPARPARSAAGLRTPPATPRLACGAAARALLGPQGCQMCDTARVRSRGRAPDQEAVEDGHVFAVEAVNDDPRVRARDRVAQACAARGASPPGTRRISATHTRCAPGRRRRRGPARAPACASSVSPRRDAPPAGPGRARAGRTLPSGLSRRNQAGLLSSWCHRPVLGSFSATSAS